MTVAVRLAIVKKALQCAVGTVKILVLELRATDLFIKLLATLGHVLVNHQLGTDFIHTSIPGIDSPAAGPIDIGFSANLLRSVLVGEIRHSIFHEFQYMIVSVMATNLLPCSRCEICVDANLWHGGKETDALVLVIQ